MLVIEIAAGIVLGFFAIVILCALIQSLSGYN